MLHQAAIQIELVERASSPVSRADGRERSAKPDWPRKLVGQFCFIDKQQVVDHFARDATHHDGDASLFTGVAVYGGWSNGSAARACQLARVSRLAMPI